MVCISKHVGGINMQQKKLKFTIFSVIIHCIILFVLFFLDKVDIGMMGVWFGSFNTTLGVFAGFNHADKKVNIQGGD